MPRSARRQSSDTRNPRRTIRYACGIAAQSALLLVLVTAGPAVVELCISGELSAVLDSGGIVGSGEITELVNRMIERGRRRRNQKRSQTTGPLPTPPTGDHQDPRRRSAL